MSDLSDVVKVKEELEGAWEKYEQAVLKVARASSKNILQPYLLKHGIAFVAGMGAYSMTHIKSGKSIYEEHLPEHLYELLSMTVPGLEANDLGSLMPDFNGMGGKKGRGRR